MKKKNMKFELGFNYGKKNWKKMVSSYVDAIVGDDNRIGSDIDYVQPPVNGKCWAVVSIGGIEPLPYTEDDFIIGNKNPLLWVKKISGK